MRKKFKPGDIVKHFKHERLDTYERSLNMCMYEVVGEASHTEDGKVLVIYKSLQSGELFARPRESFYSKVDKKKYPDITQEYRFV